MSRWGERSARCTKEAIREASRSYPTNVQNGGGHIGVYLGGGKMISALNPTQGTFVHDVNAMPVVGYVTFR